MGNGNEPATKQDIAQLRGEISQDITQLRGEISQDIAQLRGEMTHDIAQLRGEMSQNIAQLRGEMSQNIAQLRGEMSQNIEQLRGEANHQYRDVVERISDSETRLLKAFYDYADSNNKRMVQIEGNSAAFLNRIGALENRILEIEKRLNMPPPQ
jgi:gas vesicle protein